MILYAMIARTPDGLPLSASTDTGSQTNQESQESRKYLKILAKQLGQNEEICSVKMYSHIVHFISSFGISYLALCENMYPAVLAFSFLNDVQKEFVTHFDMKNINSALRPYAFIEFDSSIQKLRQRYNNPRTLTTRVSLSEMSAELSQRPPKQLVLNDIVPSFQKNGPIMATPGCRANLLPMSLYSVASLIISSLCCLISIYRGISALSVSTLEEPEGVSPSHGFAFLLEAVAIGMQILLLISNVKWRVPIVWLSLSTIILCNLSVWKLQEFLFTVINVSVATGTTLAILSLTPIKKSNYNV